ncbi:FMN-linked oxidoreductase [Cylindrobasidium torrendii FP15055 ss-10]|uniref:FMN-linked oxidoreductase n=1 Tax=Cylindrobasidium torrendii FP15055 ss-10 TaxID=1314674 RepID=A0A0D7BKG3_9AGAR|nr:FMN-linked oxidoreductase [Cylindrobasidium torrendii FP15055 ss-10]
MSILSRESLTEKPALFRPYKLGNIELQHRIVHAPLTRYKAGKDHVQLPIVKEYYRQRTQTPGTLIISEATFITHKAGINPHCPGIYTTEQIRAWREITDVVHTNNCFMFCQIWGLGRSADYEASRLEDPSWSYVSSSPVQLSTKGETPRVLTIPEIQQYVRDFGDAAEVSVGDAGAGFDGVELHFANGYLMDQFFQDVCNKRTDAYGGSVENRCRFPLEVVDEVVKRIGPQKVGVRVSPWSPFQDMGMGDPKPTFTYFVTQLRDNHPDLAFVHVVEPRITGSATVENAENMPQDQSNDFIRDIWAPRPLISAGLYLRESAIKVADEKGDLIAFGRHFLSNPDLPERIMKDLPLNDYHRETFYLRGDESGKGYLDYEVNNTYRKEGS